MPSAIRPNDRLPALVRDHRPLSAADQRLLKASVPPELAFDARTTVRVERASIPGRLWVAEASLSDGRMRSVCIYYHLASQRGLMVLCFSEETYRRGRAVEVFGTPSGTMLVGLVPTGTRAVGVSTGTGANAQLAFRDGVYARLLPERPRLVTVASTRGITRIDFVAGAGAARPG
jgi:hypothetical protein